jgi:hypothetical protein
VALAGLATAVSGVYRRRLAGAGGPVSSAAGGALSPFGLKPGGGPPTRPLSSLARVADLAASPLARATAVVSRYSWMVARSLGPSSVKMAKATSAPPPG